MKYKLICSFLFMVYCCVAITGCTQDLNEHFSIDPEAVQNAYDLQVNIAGKQQKVNFNSKFTVRFIPPPPGSGFELEVEGEGTATRMGKAKLLMVQTIHTISDTEPWKAVAESAVITSVNGDELHFGYESTVDVSNSPDMKFRGICIVNGGTGAYKQAAGTLEFSGMQNWNSGKGSATFKGVITF